MVVRNSYRQKKTQLLNHWSWQDSDFNFPGDEKTSTSLTEEQKERWYDFIYI